MATLANITAQAQAHYYQNWAPDDSFFDEVHFKLLAAQYYSTELNTQYQALRKENKAETGFSSVDISPQWLLEQVIKPEDIKYDTEREIHYFETSYPIFAFNFDGFANGLNGIRPYGPNTKLKKLNINEIRFWRDLPVTPNIYYWVEGDRRVVLTKNPNCKLVPHYIPAVVGADDQCQMADTIVSMVIEKTLTLMFGAKKEVVIDKTDDQNKNAIMQLETNPDLKKTA